jgi:hypothetical protein
MPRWTFTVLPETPVTRRQLQLLVDGQLGGVVHTQRGIVRADLGRKLGAGLDRRRRLQAGIDAPLDQLRQDHREGGSQYDHSPREYDLLLVGLEEHQKAYVH